MAIFYVAVEGKGTPTKLVLPKKITVHFSFIKRSKYKT